MNIVIDASVGIQWVVAETSSARAIKLVDRPLIVPSLFYTECANILWKKVVRGELTAATACDCATLLGGVRIRIVPDVNLFVGALELACKLGHPAYDCLYLTLANSEKGILVTADERLIERCRQAQVPWVKETVRALNSFDS